MNYNKIRIALRFDDPSPCSDQALEKNILTILENLGIPITIAVVPFCNNGGTLTPVSRASVPHLVKAYGEGRIDIAQHGYSHAPLSNTPNGELSEFWGIPAEQQQRHIDSGQHALRETFGRSITGFIPPWNTYDHTTADYLAQRGYIYLSGSLATPQEGKHLVTTIPRTCDIHQIREAYHEACARPYLSHDIIVIMHHYDFQEHSIKPGRLALEQFKNDLAWIKSMPNVRFTTLSLLSEDISLRKSRKICTRHIQKNLAHWRIQRWLPKHLLMTRPLWCYLRPSSAQQ